MVKCCQTSLHCSVLGSGQSRLYWDKVTAIHFMGRLWLAGGPGDTCSVITGCIPISMLLTNHPP